MPLGRTSGQDAFKQTDKAAGFHETLARISFVVRECFTRFYRRLCRGIEWRGLRRLLVCCLCDCRFFCDCLLYGRRFYSMVLADCLDVWVMNFQNCRGVAAWVGLGVDCTGWTSGDAVGGSWNLFDRLCVLNGGQVWGDGVSKRR